MQNISTDNMKFDDLFASVVQEDRTHTAFRALRDSEAHVAARQLMNQLYLRMGDPTGRFLTNFQANGFHTRLFELACFAYLESAGLSVDCSFDPPDFMASRGSECVAVEAATAGHPESQSSDISAHSIELLSEEEMADKCQNEFPIRMASILSSKVRRRYWNLPHVKGKSLVLMVAPFFEAGSVYYTDDSLATYLYGLVDKHHYGTRTVRSGFFLQDQAKHISAVAYCNGFTVPRFFRIAYPDREESAFGALRKGHCYLPLDESSFSLAKYEYKITDPSAPEEPWCQGVTVFENPNALIPLHGGLMPRTSTFRVIEGDLIREVHGFHPLTSVMIGFRNPQENAL